MGLHHIIQLLEMVRQQMHLHILLLVDLVEDILLVVVMVDLVVDSVKETVDQMEAMV